MFAGPHAMGAAPQLTPNDGHSLISIGLATNWIICGKYSTAFRGDEFRAFIMAPGSERMPLRTVPALIAGSDERYCRLTDQPLRNNENALMLTIAGILAINPHASLADIGYGLRWIRLALVAVAALAMLRCGVSVWVTAGIAYASIMVMAAVEETRFYSVYPFLPVLLTSFIALLVLLLDTQMHVRLRSAVTASALAGFPAAVAANFRSSYLPILIACFAVWILIGASERRARSATSLAQLLAGAALQFGAFSLAFVIFHVVFIRPIDRLPATQNLSYHVIAHPIVLGLAIPPNPLARREGIEWNDRVGLDLARRIDPGVTEMNQQYENALFAYYWGLWRQHPDKMASLYWKKLRLAGADMPKYQGPPVSDRFFKVTLWPVSLIPHGALRAGILCILTVAPLLFVRRWGAAPCGLISMTCLTALLLTIETALILTLFYISHEASALLFAVACGLMFYQAAIDCTLAVARRVVPAGPRAQSRAEPTS